MYQVFSKPLDKDTNTDVRQRQQSHHKAPHDHGQPESCILTSDDLSYQRPPYLSHSYTPYSTSIVNYLISGSGPWTPVASYELSYNQRGTSNSGMTYCFQISSRGKQLILHLLKGVCYILIQLFRYLFKLGACALSIILKINLRYLIFK